MSPLLLTAVQVFLRTVAGASTVAGLKDGQVAKLFTLAADALQIGDEAIQGLREATARMKAIKDEGRQVAPEDWDLLEAIGAEQHAQWQALDLTEGGQLPE